MGQFKQCPDADMVAVCDVYEPRRSQAKEKDAPRAREFGDYRQVLDQKDIDAVVIATPNHWHTPRSWSQLAISFVPKRRQSPDLSYTVLLFR